MPVVIGLCVPEYSVVRAQDAKREFAPNGKTAPVSYWRDIRPIFQANCQGCHQPAKTEGEYVMTDFAKLLAGGESEEAAIIPGKPGESYLVEQITPVDGHAEMPRGKKPLGEVEIELITRWIAQGADDDSPPSVRARYDMDHPPLYNVAPVITSLDFSDDGRVLAISGYHEVLLHRVDPSQDPPARLMARLVGMSERIEAAVFSPDGQRLAVAGGSPGRLGELQVWDVPKRSLVLSALVSYDTCYGASWSPDGKLVSIGCPDNSVRVFAVASGKQVFSNASHNDWVLDTVFSKQGSHLVSVSRDGFMKLMEVGSERFLDNIIRRSPRALQSGLYTVDRHPLKNHVIVGGADGTVSIFRMFREENGRRKDGDNIICKLKPMPGRVFDVKFSADGTQVVAASSHHGKGEVRVYNVCDAQPVASMRGFSGSIYAATINRTGRVVAAGGDDGTVSFHDAASGNLLGRFMPFPLQQ